MQPCLERRGKPLRVIIGNRELYRAVGKGFLHPVMLMAGDDNDRARMGSQHLIHHAHHHGHAIIIRDQQLVQRRHAARTAGGKHNRRHAAASAWRQGRRWRARGLFTRQRAQFNLLEQAANTHGADIFRRHIKPRKKPLQYPIKAIQLGAPRTARQHHGGDFADMPKAEQIAGINRHAEMINHAAGAHNRGGANIAPIHHGGSAGHQQHLSTRAT